MSIWFHPFVLDIAEMRLTMMRLTMMTTMMVLLSFFRFHAQLTIETLWRNKGLRSKAQ